MVTKNGDGSIFARESTMMKKNRTVPILILILVCAFLFTWKLGSLTFVDEDEATYAKVAQEMVTSKDWIYPTCNYSPFIDKPPLIYWGNAFSFKLLGMNEFAVRFWHAIIGVLGVLVTYFIAGELFSEKRGVFSGLILATSLQYFYQARMTLCDIPLTFFITLSLYFFLVFINHRNTLFYYFSIVTIALATLTKGPIGIIVPVLIISSYLFFTREKLFVRNTGFHILTGLLVFFGIVAPWFVMQILHYKWRFIQEFFIYTNLERAMHPIGFTSPTGKPDPFYYYIFVIVAGFLPWSGVMFHSIGSAIKSVWKYVKELSSCPKEIKNEFFVLVWAATVFIIFSIFGMKAPRYIMPIYPALAIISGKFFAEIANCRHSGSGSVREKENGVKFLPFLLSIIFAPFIIAAVIVAKRVSPDAAMYMPVLSPTLIILGVGIFFSAASLLKNKKIAFVCFFITAFASYVALIVFADKNFNNLRISKPFAEKVTQTLKEGDEIINYRPPSGEGVSIAFYTNHRMNFVRDEKEIISRLNSNQKIFCVVRASDLKQLQGKIPVNILDERMGRVLFVNRTN